VLSQVLLGFDRIPLKSVAQYSPADCNKQCPLCRILSHPTTILAIASIFKSADSQQIKSTERVSPNNGLLGNCPPQAATTWRVMSCNRTCAGFSMLLNLLSKANS
jgi:hypothetical protein